MIETALAPYKVGIKGITIPNLIQLLRCFFAALCTMKRSPFPDCSAERTSYVFIPMAGEPSQVSLISGILANPKLKIQRRSLWNLIMD